MACSVINSDSSSLGGLAWFGHRLGKAVVAGSNPARGSMFNKSTYNFVYYLSEFLTHTKKSGEAMGFGFGNAIFLNTSHANRLKSDECAKHTYDSFCLQISFFFFRHFLILLKLCLTVVALHGDTICPFSDLCISNLNITYISYKRFPKP